MLGSPLNLESRLGPPHFEKLSFVAEALGPEVSSAGRRPIRILHPYAGNTLVYSLLYYIIVILIYTEIL